MAFGLFILTILKFRKPALYKEGKKVANTDYIKEMPYYKKAMRKYKVLSILLKLFCIIAIIMSLILISRPGIPDAESVTQYNRDIILCMDVSDSVNELNEKLVTDLKKVVKKLKEERIGISVFNTSSVTLIPLTDDYDYILNKLDELQRSFKTRIDYINRNIYDINNTQLATSYLHSGTLVGNDIRGSSLIGDGLASSINLFGDLNENRTRIVIFTTDNELYGKEIVTLEEAGEICKRNNVTVFGIAPRTIKPMDKISMQEAIEVTGGRYYTEGEKNSVSNIVNNIEKIGKSKIKAPKSIKIIDKPQMPFIFLTVSIMGVFILDKKVNV